MANKGPAGLMTLFSSAPSSGVHPVEEVEGLMDEVERERLMETHEYGGVKLKARSLPHLLQQHAATNADKPFVQCWDEGLKRQFTYAEFSRRVTGAAVAMAEDFGVRLGDRCAILAHNSPDYITLSLGIMRCRGTSVNLNWRSPGVQLSELAKKVECKILFASNRFKEQAQQICESNPGLRVSFIEEMDIRSFASRTAGGRFCDTEPDDVAAIFFTSGSTSLPKAVPHTHNELLWLAHQNLVAVPEPYQATDPNAATLCFFPFFHVMGFSCDMCLGLYAGIKCLVHADAANATLTPDLMMRACAQLRPTVLHTTPWMIEGFCEALEGGSAVSGCFDSLHFVIYGGAALKPHCSKVLKKHGIQGKCGYGQTEVCGATCYGKLGGDPNALTPLPGITFSLTEEGELIMHGVFCATTGYVAGTAPNARPLTRTASTYDDYRTGDLFKVADIDQAPVGKWLLYDCREDDILVHSTGEMTNPLQVELQVGADCKGFVTNVIMVGDGLPSPVMMVQLNEGFIVDEETAGTLWRSVTEAQAMQPAYSQLSKSRVVILGPTEVLPTSAKGNVIRSKCDKMFQEGVADVAWSHLLGSDSDEEEEQDSLEFSRERVASSKVSEYQVIKENCYFLGILSVVFAHYLEIFAGKVGWSWAKPNARAALMMFMVFAGMDDKKRHPTPSHVLRLLAITLTYVLAFQPLVRGSAIAARIAGFPPDWALDVSLRPRGFFHVPPAGLAYTTCVYEGPYWFLWDLLHAKCLAMAGRLACGGHWSWRFVLAAAVAVAFFSYNPDNYPDDPRESLCRRAMQDPNNLRDLNIPTCYATTGWTDAFKVVAWKLLGGGFWLPDYLLKFVYTSGRGPVYIVGYMVGLCLPPKLLPAWNSELLSDPSKLGLFGLRVALGCVAALATTGSVPGSKWLSELDNDGKMDKVLALLQALAWMQAMPRLRTIFGQIGMNSLLILLLHYDVWFLQLLLRGPWYRAKDYMDLFDSPDQTVFAPWFLLALLTVYTCLLGRIRFTCRSSVEVLGYMIAWQCAKQILQLYCDMDASEQNSISLLIEAFATFLVANAEFLGFASIATLLLVVRQYLGCDVEIGIIAAVEGSWPFKGMAAGGCRAWAWVRDKHVAHTNPAINAWFVFVELFIIYHSAHMVTYLVWHEFCPVQITATSAALDVFSTQKVAMWDCWPQALTHLTCTNFFRNSESTFATAANGTFSIPATNILTDVGSCWYVAARGDNLTYAIAKWQDDNATGKIADRFRMMFDAHYQHRPATEPQHSCRDTGDPHLCASNVVACTDRSNQNYHLQVNLCKQTCGLCD